MIVGVSVKFDTGIEVRLPRPNRHADCFRVAKEDYGIDPIHCVGAENQGFYTNSGEYLNRSEAMRHVRSVGQDLLADLHDGDFNESDYLFSEDVWRDG